MQRALAFIFVTALLDAIGFGIIAPVMPRLLMQVTGQDLTAAARYGGILMTVYAGMQFCFAPVMGNLSDRFGRRAVLIASLTVLFFDYMMMSWAPSIGWLFLGRLVAGIAASTFSICGAFIADITPPEKRAQGFGVIGAAFGLGFVIGPVVGGLLSAYGVRAPFMGAGALCAFNLLYGLLVLPETLAKENRRAFDWRRANPIGTLAALRKYPAVLGLTSAYFLFLLGHQSLQSVWSYFTIERFHWNEAQIGYSLGFIGVLMTLVQAFGLRWLLARVGERRAAYFGYTCAIVSFVGYALSTHAWMLYVFLVAGALQGFVSPALRGLMSAQIPPNAQGELQGGLASLMSLSLIVTPPAATQIFGYFTQSGAPVYFPGAPWLAAAALTLWSLIAFGRSAASESAPAKAAAG
jgi:DHA1 family tetracycline resistance protein-like MFS transporter